jgi:hypothetical protein
MSARVRISFVQILYSFKSSLSFTTVEIVDQPEELWITLKRPPQVLLRLIFVCLVDGRGSRLASGWFSFDER